MPVETVLNARVPVKIWTDRIEPQAIAQLKNTASLPFVFKHVAAMADVHLGIGATVGSVVATKGAVCPAAVGVDIGCGMMAQKTSIPADRFDGEALKKLRHSIEREIPVGFAQKREPFDAALELMRGREKPHAASDEDDGMLWLLLHSGSRHIGNSVAEKHIDRAKSGLKQMSQRLPDPDLAYFVAGTKEFRKYREDVEWCQ